MAFDIDTITDIDGGPYAYDGHHWWVKSWEYAEPHDGFAWRVSLERHEPMPDAFHIEGPHVVRNPMTGLPVNVYTRRQTKVHTAALLLDRDGRVLHADVEWRIA